MTSINYLELINTWGGIIAKNKGRYIKKSDLHFKISDLKFSYITRLVQELDSRSFTLDKLWIYINTFGSISLICDDEEARLFNSLYDRITDLNAEEQKKFLQKTRNQLKESRKLEIELIDFLLKQSNLKTSIKEFISDYKRKIVGFDS